METIEGIPHESARLFNATFWLECEREADRIVRTMTDADGQQLADPPPAPPPRVTAPRQPYSTDEACGT
jgi:hypothetical protein